MCEATVSVLRPPVRVAAAAIVALVGAVGAHDLLLDPLDGRARPKVLVHLRDPDGGALVAPRVAHLCGVT